MLTGADASVAEVAAAGEEPAAGLMGGSLVVSFTPDDGVAASAGFAAVGGAAASVAGALAGGLVCANTVSGRAPLASMMTSAFGKCRAIEGPPPVRTAVAPRVGQQHCGECLIIHLWMAQACDWNLTCLSGPHHIAVCRASDRFGGWCVRPCPGVGLLVAGQPDARWMNAG